MWNKMTNLGTSKSKMLLGKEIWWGGYENKKAIKEKWTELYHKLETWGGEKDIFKLVKLKKKSK